jgi:hypothetical protein
LVGALVLIAAAVGGAAWALGRGDESPPPAAVALVKPVITEPATGTRVSVGAPVDIRFDGAVPDGAEARLYVDGTEVEAELDGTTFTHVFLQPGEPIVNVRLQTPTVSKDSEPLSLIVS